MVNIDKGNGLVLEEITFPGGNSIRLKVRAPSGEERVFNYSVHENGMVGLSPEYSNDYMRVPGPPFPRWPNEIAARAWAARQQPIPTGERWEEIMANAYGPERWSKLRPRIEDGRST